MDDNPLANWLASHQIDIATQRRITQLLDQHIGQCEIDGCENVTLQDPDISWETCELCLFCGKECCLAEHMAYISLLERYGFDFREHMDYPDACEVCNVCLAIIDEEYKQWLRDPSTLHRDRYLKKFRKKK